MFGGTTGHYAFTHPTDPMNERRKSLDQQLLPEDGGTFATALVVRAGLDFFCYLRFSDFIDGSVVVSLIGADDITCTLHKYGEGNIESMTAFCQKLQKAVVQKITGNPRLTTAKVVKVNQYNAERTRGEAA